MILVRAQGFVAIASIGLAVPAFAAVPTVATFDVDAEGFVGSTTSTVLIHSGTGGNPDGHIEIRKDLTPPVFDIGAETKTSPDFLGDYAAGGITGAGFDLNVFNNSIDAVWLRFRPDIVQNGWHYDFGAVAANSNQWELFDVAFDPTWDDATAGAMGWVQEDGAASFAAVLGGVGWIEVRVLHEGSTIAGVDNVRLVPAPSPAAIALMATGFAARRRRR